MPVYTFSGVTVDFPYEAYDCQALYMQKVVQALQECSNALLESPTGTGKTLCLLCATLGWRQAVLEGRIRPLHVTASVPTDGEPASALAPPPSSTVPRIVYASRTHSQLAQVVSELKKTVYKPKMCVFGSREQSCVHADVSELRGLALTHACQTLTKANGCKFHSNLMRQKQAPAGLPVHPGVLDIEEFSAMCRSKELCPFFYARELQADAELLFVPYNYLIDPKSRRALGLSGGRDILIFDEAHNVERVCTDAASIEFSSTMLAQAIAEVDRCVRVATSVDSLDEQARADANSAAVVGARGIGAAGSSSDALPVYMLARLKEILLELEKRIDALPLGADRTLTRPGHDLLLLFAAVQIDASTCEELLDVLKKAAAMLAGALHHAGGVRSSALHLLSGHVQTLFEASHSPADFKMFVKEEAAHAGRAGGGGGGGGPVGRTVSYWCLNPGVAMHELLRANNVHSLLLTSGTLSPLSSFAHELQVPFPIRLENNHVVRMDQAIVSVVKRGPSAVPLSSSYQNRGSAAYLTELGNATVNFARLVPDGMLIFFPSYSVLESTAAFWQRPQPPVDGGSAPASSIWQRLLRFKRVVVEPRGSQQALSAAIAEFEGALASGQGAVFLGVCRGKLSEGIDFADKAGRAVILTGLPLPPYKDPQVVLKRAFLDERVRAAKLARKGAGGGGGAAAPAEAELLSGDEWYTQQAMRAINQAVGRVIRHVHDYGAVLLCDERFEQPRYREALSHWLRPRVVVSETFGDVNGRLASFFRLHKQRHASGQAAQLAAQLARQSGGGGAERAADEAVSEGARGGAQARRLGRCPAPHAADALTARGARPLSEREVHAQSELSLALQLARGDLARGEGGRPAGIGPGANGANGTHACDGSAYAAARRAQLAKAGGLGVGARAAGGGGGGGSGGGVQAGSGGADGGADRAGAGARAGHAAFGLSASGIGECGVGASIAERLGSQTARHADKLGHALHGTPGDATVAESALLAAGSAPAAGGAACAAASARLHTAVPLVPHVAQPTVTPAELACRAVTRELRSLLTTSEFGRLSGMLGRAHALARTAEGEGGADEKAADALAADLRQMFAGEVRQPFLRRLAAALDPLVGSRLLSAPAARVPAPVAGETTSAPAAAASAPVDASSFLQRAKAELGADGYAQLKQLLKDIVMQRGAKGPDGERAPARPREQLAQLHALLAPHRLLQANLAQIIPSHLRDELESVVRQPRAPGAPHAQAAAGVRRPRPTVEYEDGGVERNGASRSRHV